MTNSMIIETDFGEVMLRQCYDCDTNHTWCECYIGDNWDDYIGEIEGGFQQDEDDLREKVENIL